MTPCLSAGCFDGEGVEIFLWRSVLDVELLHQVVQAGAADSECPCGAGDDVIVVFQGGQNNLALVFETSLR